MVIFHSKLWVYQRVYGHFPMGFPSPSYGAVVRGATKASKAKRVKTKAPTHKMLDLIFVVYTYIHIYIYIYIYCTHVYMYIYIYVYKRTSIYICIYTDWWLTKPLWKRLEFVNWDDDIPNIWKNRKCYQYNTYVLYTIQLVNITHHFYPFLPYIFSGFLL